ncbi:MAG: multiheme c-type cytochrome [Pirellulaceae bacterium]|nr:multiheme c-type cytochrome [Pirellulaceae bacterium]
MSHRPVILLAIASLGILCSLVVWFRMEGDSKPGSTNHSSSASQPSESNPTNADEPTSESPTVAEPASVAPSEQLVASDPNVGYVGTAMCAECHQELTDSYRKHPMYWGSTRLVSNDHDRPPSTETPIQGKKRILSAEVTDTKIVHRESMYDAEGNLIYEDPNELKYVVGSGRRGKAYVVEKDGVLCLSPLNWFARQKHWELNPGYSADDPRRFDRRANTICLQCHSGTLNPVEHGSEFLEKEPFQEMEIGCEKCHGPGREHIAFHQDSIADTANRLAKDPIVNPKGLDSFRKDSVCYQCHLQPASARILRPSRSHLDFRPGMRLDDVWIVMNSGNTIDSEGRTQSVRQVQQMTESKCYVESKSMSCTSCHDPHRVPEEGQRIEFFRQRCLECHTNSSPCSAGKEDRAAVADSCMDCHMPKLDLVLSAHAAQTDHRIVRHKAGNSEKQQDAAREFFFDETNQLPELEKRRAIAITQARKGPASDELVEELKFLRAKFPQDGFLALALGGASVSRRDYGTALECLQQAAVCPQTEELALEVLTQVTYFAKDWPRALEAFEMLLRINPYRAQTLAIKADTQFRTGQTTRAIETARESLRRNPSMIEVHQWLRDTYQKIGKTEEYEAERVLVERMQQAKPPTQNPVP